MLGTGLTKALVLLARLPLFLYLILPLPFLLSLSLTLTLGALSYSLSRRLASLSR